MRSRTAGVFVLVATALLCAAGCDTLRALGGDCGEEEGAYQEELAKEGQLLSGIPSEGPYPMALVLSQTAVNDLLAMVTGQTLPKVTQDYDGFSVELRPRLPLIQIDSVRNCAGCVLADMPFGITVDVDGLGEIGGRGSIAGGIPITLAPVDNARTRLVAGMDRVVVTDLDLTVEGLSLSDIPGLQDAVEDLATDYLREELGAKELAVLDSFSVGNGDVLLAGRGPLIFTDQKTILVGLHSNLTLASATTLEEQATLPEGVDMSLQIHPGLLLSMGERLMSEGSIARDYDEDGNTAADGPDHVTLQSIQSSSTGGALDTVFRVWRTGGGLCGWADVAADLSGSLDAQKVHLSAQNLRIIDGSGAGEILAEASWLAGDFINALVGNLELTINYRDMEVGADGTQPGFNATALSIDGRGVTVQLDLL